jgi:hypothetical protein
MDSTLDQLSDKLDQAFKHTPGFKEWLAMQTRIAARHASVRLDAWNEWNDLRQEQPEAQEQPDPLEPEVLRELRNRDTPIREQAYILTVLWNAAAGDGPLIDPWDDLDERDERDEKAELLCFRRESCDLNGDHFGLDPNPNLQNRKLWSPSPFRPCHSDELLGFVDQCLASFEAMGKEIAELSSCDWNVPPSEFEHRDYTSFKNGETSALSRDELTLQHAVANLTKVLSNQLPAAPVSPPDAAGTSEAENLSEVNYDDLPPEAKRLAIARDKCQPAEVKAWLIEQYAIQKHGSFKKLPATFAWIEEHFEPFGEDVPIDLRGYELPNLVTWRRQVTAARKATGTNVNAPRAGRPHGSSIVKVSDL